MTSLKNKTMTMDKNVTDGLNTLHNIQYNWNLETNMLDIDTFSCSYLPNDTTLVRNDTPIKKKENIFGKMF